MKCTLIGMVLAAVIVFGTGLVADDFSEIIALSASSGSFFPTWDDLSLGAQADFPAGYWLFALPYRYFGFDCLACYELLKAIYVGASIWMVARWFSLYTDELRAAVTAFLFILMPNHDTTAFCFLGQYLMFPITGYCFADYLIRRGDRVPGMVFAIFASFVSYGSTPVALSLGFLAVLERRYRDIKFLLIPNVMYVLYYLIVTQYFSLGHVRLPSEWQWITIFKSFTLQAVTFVDAAIGPSFWLKIGLSISELSVLSAATAVLAIGTVWMLWKPNERPLNRPLMVALSAMTVCALGMFAVTGRYPQLAFGLGNRVSIYGSLLVAYVLVWLAFRSRLAAVIVSAIMIVAILGVSDHWRNWSDSQTVAMNRIAKNPELSHVTSDEPVLVTGNQYSRLGGLSHIEFFSEDFVVVSVFWLARNEYVGSRVRTLNHRHYVEDHVLVDRKYGTRTQLPATVVIYDSSTDHLWRMRSDDLNGYIASLAVDRRHWAMFLPQEWLRRTVIPLMPRLEYAL